MAEERESETTLVAGIESSPLMMEVLLVAACCGRGSSRAGKKECKQRGREPGRSLRADRWDRGLSVHDAVLVILLVSFCCSLARSRVWW
jgi:hypothetical protein